MPGGLWDHLWASLGEHFSCDFSIYRKGEETSV